MIPIDPEHGQEDFRGGEMIVCLVVIAVLMAVLVSATIWHLHRAPAGAVQTAGATEARP